MFVATRAHSINSPRAERAANVPQMCTKSTVTIVLYIYIYIDSYTCVPCRRKISQLIEYLKLPNRNFKFITQCRRQCRVQDQTGPDRTSSPQTATNCRQPVERPFNGHYLFDVWPSLTPPPLLLTLFVSLTLSCSWFGIKCHLIAI